MGCKIAYRTSMKCEVDMWFLRSIYLYTVSKLKATVVLLLNWQNFRLIKHWWILLFTIFYLYIFAMFSLRHHSQKRAIWLKSNLCLRNRIEDLITAHYWSCSSELCMNFIVCLLCKFFTNAVQYFLRWWKSFCC